MTFCAKLLARRRFALDALIWIAAAHPAMQIGRPVRGVAMTKRSKLKRPEIEEVFARFAKQQLTVMNTRKDT